jgi:hypothetical protein
MHEGVENAYMILVRRSEGKRSLRRPNRWENIVKVVLKEIGCESRVVWLVGYLLSKLENDYNLECKERCS